jgi:predicted deacetylase
VSDWLTPVRKALDVAEGTVRCFFRDDDAGLDDERLLALLEVFGRLDVPVDLAVIPMALTPSLAGKLRALGVRTNGKIGLHQHGLRHANHQRSGRKSEFGEDRPTEAILEDIRDGKRRLEELFGGLVQPVFTPPWNRCCRATGSALAELGFRVLSRDEGSPPLRVHGLLEINVRVDWFAHRGGVRRSRPELGQLLADRITQPGATGIMLHHARMDASERQALEELLRLLRSHDRALSSPLLESAHTESGQNVAGSTDRRPA